MSRELSVAERRQRVEAATIHGGYSQTRIAAKARGHKRRFLRRGRLKASDLGAIEMELLNLFARGCAQLDLREEGGVDAGKDYWVAYNGVRRTLERLERRLKAQGLDRGPQRDPLDALRELEGAA
jgi:hypothetical protein